jgi:hypothetical protein
MGCAGWWRFSREQERMDSKGEFARDIALAAAKEKGDSFVFIIELDKGLDENVVRQAEAMLVDLVGQDHLTTFRVR